MSTSIPLPVPEPNADSRAYWAAAREGRLTVRQCLACGERHFMPRGQCPVCWSDALEWIDCSGFGTVYSLSIVHRAPTPDFAAITPYVTALVALEEGPRMYANIVGPGALESVIGDRVRVVFERRGEAGMQIPQFTRVAGQSGGSAA
ncbi:MAG TPA: Zn-ribbon domain-containing OB-fold protein [Ideonella sp.]|nr:Zn-ribbon domain-containing OB-fold protein [Ideonella sp.]